MAQNYTKRHVMHHWMLIFDFEYNILYDGDVKYRPVINIQKRNPKHLQISKPNLKECNIC